MSILKLSAFDSKIECPITYVLGSGASIRENLVNLHCL